MKLPPDIAQEILSTSSEAIVVADDTGIIVFVNAQAERLFGYSPGEMRGQPIDILLPENLRESHARQRRQFHAAPRARPIIGGLTLKGRRRNGEIFDARIALTPIKSGEAVLVASSIRAIDEDSMSEATFRQMLELAPDAMIIVDSDGRIALANNQAVTLFGYAREALIGQTVEMLLPEALHAAHAGHRRDYAADPHMRPMGRGLELYGRRADGSTFPVEISLSPVVSAAGTFVSSAIRDVSERKTLESALIEARKAAEQANKANTAFLAAASHDLRQPVQALSLLTGALRRTLKTPQALAMVESQQHSLDAMTNLLNSLLDISRLDAGAVTAEFEDFPIQRLIHRLSAEFARQARQKGLEFTSDSSAAIVRSDPNLLAEVIQNLVSNAIRYTGTGKVELNCVEEPDELCLQVRDTGIGIEKQHFEAIFQEFHQIRSAGAPKQGFGLGLAIVRRMAGLLGVQIRVESTPGQGSCFTVCIPLARAGLQMPDETETAGPATDRADNGGLVVLIEDDEKVADAWRLLLEAEGLQVATAASAPEAQAIAEYFERAPDLIISDFHLADGSTGVDAVTQIRAVFKRVLPAFIVSGDTSKVVQAARSLENSILMSKPVAIDQLLALARSAINTGRVPGGVEIGDSQRDR